jgi:hypothetical protein
MLSTSAGRRKRVAPMAATPPASVIANAAPHATMFATSLPIAVCRDAALAAAAARVPDPPLTAMAPIDVADAVAVRMRTLLPTLIPYAKFVASLPVDVCEALVQQVASVALDALALEWPRAVEDERVRHAAAAERHQREAAVAGQWNRRSRAVAVLGAPGMGYGFNVLPFLRRSMEGVVVHGASAELRGACRRTKWLREVLRHLLSDACDRLCLRMSVFVHLADTCLVDLSCGVVCSPSRVSLCGRSVRTVKISVSSGVCKD